jgi:hypothetical protein
MSIGALYPVIAGIFGLALLMSAWLWWRYVPAIQERSERIMMSTLKLPVKRAEESPEWLKRIGKGAGALMLVAFGIALLVRQPHLAIMV